MNSICNVQIMKLNLIEKRHRLQLDCVVADVCKICSKSVSRVNAYKTYTSFVVVTIPANNNSGILTFDSILLYAAMFMLKLSLG